MNGGEEGEMPRRPRSARALQSTTAPITVTEPETPMYSRDTLEEMVGLNDTRGHYSIREKAQKEHLVDSIIQSKLLDVEARAAILRKHDAFSTIKNTKPRRATLSARRRDRNGVRSNAGHEKDVAAEPKDAETTMTTVRDGKVYIPVEDVRVETRCSICMGIIKRTKTVMPCLHRYGCV